MPNKYGIWIITDSINLNLWNKYKSSFNGVRLRKNWKPFETARNTFDNSYWLNDINQALADGKYISILSNVAPYDTGSTPPYVFQLPDVVPLETTDKGQFPYPLNPATFGRTGSWNWLTRFENHWSKIKDVLLLIDSNIDKVISWQSAEFSTGDPGGQKGTTQRVTINGVTQSNPSAYTVDDFVWRDHKRLTLWVYQKSLIDANFPSVHQMVNISNDGQDFEWIQDNLGGNAHVKFGFPTHNYNMCNEIFRANMGNFFAANGEHNRVQSEWDNTMNLAWFQAATKKNTKALIASAIHCGTDIMNIALSTINTICGDDVSVLTWANQYMGVRDSDNPTKGFCLFRKIIDVNADWSSITAEPVINPMKLYMWERMVANVNSGDFGAVQKQVKISINTVSQGYVNPALVTALKAEFTDAAWISLDVSEDHDAYNSDYVFDGIPDNYYKRVKQINPDGTSKGYWRVGPLDTWDGRFARGFDLAHSPTWDKIYMVDDGLLPDHANTYQVKVDVVYLDSGTSNWSLQYHNGTIQSSAGNITKTNSGLWKTASFSIAKCKAGGLLANSSDLILKHESGTDNTIFSTFELTRVAINTDSPPVVIINTTDATLNAPVTSFAVSASITDQDGADTITGKLWTYAGPGATIDDIHSPSTTFRNLTIGSHVFTLTGTDDADVSSSDSIVVIVVKSDVVTDYLLNCHFTNGNYSLDSGIVSSGEMHFAVNQTSGIPQGRSNVTISFQYLDLGTNFITVYCACKERKRNVLSVRLTNSGQIRTATVAVNSFDFNGLLQDASDFIIDGAYGTLYKLISIVKR